MSALIKKYEACMFQRFVEPLMNDLLTLNTAEIEAIVTETQEALKTTKGTERIVGDFIVSTAVAVLVNYRGQCEEQFQMQKEAAK